MRMSRSLNAGLVLLLLGAAPTEARMPPGAQSPVEDQLPIEAESATEAPSPAEAQPSREAPLLEEALSFPAPFPPTEKVGQGDGRPSTALLVAGGLLAGAAGFFGGALAGAALTECEVEDDYCVLGGAIVGAGIGESLLMPVGVHVGDAGRGDLAPGMLASAAIGAAGLAGLYISDFDPPAAPVIVVVAPLAQLLATIAIERSTADRRAETQRVEGW
jgi:hypothetical protein